MTSEEFNPASYKLQQLPCNLHSTDDDVNLQTPDVTPAASFNASPPKTPPPKKISKPEKKEPVFVDPWEGVGHPLEFEANPHLGHRSASPDIKVIRDDVCDVIVMRSDEEVADAGVQADTSESSLDEATESQTDQTISQGELVISHGEIKPKEIPHLNKLMPYHDDTDVSSNQNEELSEERSEGEINPRNLRRKIPRLPPQYPSVYARPRRPLPTSDSLDDVDEMSAGEVVADKMPRSSETRKERFEKWKQQQRVEETEDEDALAHVSVGEYLVDDVTDDVDDVIDVSDDVVVDAANNDDVIDTIRVDDVIQVEEIGGGFAMESTLQTTGNSQIPIDSLDEAAGKNVAAATENFPSVILEDSEQDF